MPGRAPRRVAGAAPSEVGAEVGAEFGAEVGAEVGPVASSQPQQHGASNLEDSSSKLDEDKSSPSASIDMNQESSTKLRTSVVDAAEAAVALASSLKQENDEPVKLEEVMQTAKQLMGATKAAAVVAREQAAQLVSAVPTAREVAATVSQAELPMQFVHAPFLFGLFVPPPQWPPRTHTVSSFVRAATLPVGIVLVVSALGLGVLVVLLAALPLLVPVLFVCTPVVAPVLLLLLHRRSAVRRQADAAAVESERLAANTRFEEDPTGYLSTKTRTSRERRTRFAEQLLSDVSSRAVGQHDTPFNQHVKSATGLAIYGCGVLAATHVGALRALERHGLDYSKIETLAGVSAGAVVVAMLAVGCTAEEVQALIISLDFSRLVKPELGSLLRAGANLLLGSFLHRSVSQSSEGVIERGHGPGINSGRVLEEMVGAALRARTGDAGITLGDVHSIYGKRLVLVATELDSGKERRFTPETDPLLPVRAAVRMSMGIPGAFEPFRYQGHVYCDGGMVNDFPIVCLPDRAHRLGLCVKQATYVSYNMGASIHDIVGPAFESYPTLMAQLERAQSTLWTEGAYPTREMIDYATTCVNIMMDANLDLQIEAARRTLRAAKRAKAAGGTPTADEAYDGDSSPAPREDLERRGDVFELAPQILTLCSGALQPFDFGLTRAQHHELFLAGQLFAHLYAAVLGSDSTTPCPPTLSDEQRLKALLWVLHMDYP